MTTHLSARLAWHDRGWDGHICDAPALNSFCLVHQHIREARDDATETRLAGRLIADCSGFLPPCSRDPAVFSAHGYTEVHRDPLDFRNLPPAEENIPPYSFCTSPYRWMREENVRTICEAENIDLPPPTDHNRTAGWVYEPSRQLTLLHHFWDKLELRKSLVFLYCNQGNPVDENCARLIVGAGCLKAIATQRFFGNKPGYPDEYPVWSRCLTHNCPEEGFRLPYQEYIRGGHDLMNIVCRVPEGAMLNFSYVAEHVSDDLAVGILERLLQSVATVQREGKVPGDWSGHLLWLNDALSGVWTNRGQYPGTGSVLQYLGFRRGTAYHRLCLTPLETKGEDIFDYINTILAGDRIPEEPEYRRELEEAAIRWRALPESREVLLRLLCRFELSPEQVHRIANPDARVKAGIKSTDQELIDNPYLIYEQDQGATDSEPVALEVIDHGLRPEHGLIWAKDKSIAVAHDDPRRVRGVMTSVLRDAANQGDTVLPFAEALKRVEERFPERRACRPDRDLILGQATFYQQAFVLYPDSKPPSLALKNLDELECEVRQELEWRVQKRNPPVPANFSWKKLLGEEFGSGKGTKLDPEVEERAQTEKEKALNILFGNRFSVLTGRAGTGKTSVIKVFLNGLEQIEGRKPVLLLAPTGKARVRLSVITERPTYTIHQFLLSLGWLIPETFGLRFEGGNKEGAPVVIIDEASMIPMDLLGVLFRALDLNQVRRLIFVGDPNQLPPIGPGRPFADIIGWLDADNERQKCLTTLIERARQEKKDSLSLKLADGYLQAEPTPHDDEMLSRVAKREVEGDLEVHFWESPEHLKELLQGRMDGLLSLSQAEKAYEAFNRSLGIDRNDYKEAERWQILSPLRGQPFGTTELNRIIQLAYRGGVLTLARRRGSRPFGEQEIVWTDKVIQTVNTKRKGWPRQICEDYVANGEIGIVSSTRKNPDCLEVVFSTQEKFSYRYFRQEVDQNLELAYALTVHKSQGSDFDIVFFILPKAAPTLSRELLYTALTRFRKKLVLLLEKDTAALEAFRRPERSDTLLRNTNLFVLSVRPETVELPFAEHLIHRTAKGVLVRSKSEVIVADTLTRLGLSYEYEERLEAPGNPKDFRLPDFTVTYRGDIFYWEHLGMIHVPSYRHEWEHKLEWYITHGYADQLITSQEGEDGGIDATEIERIARTRILEVK